MRPRGEIAAVTLETFLVTADDSVSGLLERQLKGCCTPLIKLSLHGDEHPNEALTHRIQLHLIARGVSVREEFQYATCKLPCEAVCGA